jgi:hypothetical protein
MTIKWTPDLEETIIKGLEDYSLRRLCALNPDLPNRDSITDYMGRNDVFSAKCARAREDNAETMDDRILEVAQKVEYGVLDAKAGSVVISALQWRASKLKPKKYGDKQAIEHSGEVTIGLAERINAARKRGNDDK